RLPHSIHPSEIPKPSPLCFRTGCARPLNLRQTNLPRTRTVDDFRKAAILLQHLDPESRNQILAKLPEAQQQQIASLLNTTIEVDAGELTEIVREYQAQFQKAQTAPDVEIPVAPLESFENESP